MSDLKHPLIVCGYDGSPTARAALAHAVGLVGDGHLVALHAYAIPTGSEPMDYGVLAQGVEAVAQRLLDELPGVEPGLERVSWEGRKVAGPPAGELTRLASELCADGIVIGSRGVGYLHALLGSVAYETIHLASCPVTVIPSRSVQTDPAAY